MGGHPSLRASLRPLPASQRVRRRSEMTLTETTFDETLATTDELLLVDFWAPWCGPCRALSPILEALERDEAGRLKVAKVNVDDEPTLAGRYALQAMPTILFVQGRRRVGTV